MMTSCVTCQRSPRKNERGGWRFFWNDEGFRLRNNSLDTRNADSCLSFSGKICNPRVLSSVINIHLKVKTSKQLKQAAGKLDAVK